MCLYLKINQCILKAIFIKIFFFGFLSCQLCAQELLPFVENYSKSNYQGDNQIWNVVQGKIAPLAENHRTGLLWNLFMQAPEVKVGLKKLGFSSTQHNF